MGGFECPTLLALACSSHARHLRQPACGRLFISAVPAEHFHSSWLAASTPTTPPQIPPAGMRHRVRPGKLFDDGAERLE